MISASDRREALELIGADTTAEARTEAACEVIGLRLQTYRRWRSQGTDGGQDQRPEAARPAPVNKLSEHEQQYILQVCNQEQKVGNPRYILDSLLSIINVSVQTVDIISRLPKLDFED